MTKNHIKFFILIVATVLLSVFLYRVDFDKVYRSLMEVGANFWWIILVTGLAYSMATVAWMLCFKTHYSKLPFTKLFAYRQIGETLALINPTNIVAGESSKIYLIKNIGINTDEGFVSIMLSRVLIAVSLLALLLVCIGGYFEDFVTSEDQLHWHLISVLLLFLLVAWFFIALVSKKLFVYRFWSRIDRLINSKFTNKLSVKIQEMNLQLSTFYQGNKAKILVAFILSALHWVMGAVEFYLILNFIDMDVSFFDAMMIEMGVTVIKNFGAFIPGQIGIEEYGNKLMLDFVGATTPGLWVTVSILRRARQLFWVFIGGIFFVFMFKKI